MFDIKKSDKSYINSKEHFIVVMNETVYIRIIGEEGNYLVITATAGEDCNGIKSFGNQIILNEAAFIVAEMINTKSEGKYDFHNRGYVEICTCEYISDAYRAAEMLFKILDERSKFILNSN